MLLHARATAGNHQQKACTMEAPHDTRDDLLTAREVQALLKIDRTTIYRMLQDARLSGVKVGQQWRFSRREVDALLAGGRVPPRAGPETDSALLPAHCVQAIQDLFADITGIGAITLLPSGAPLTRPSGAFLAMDQCPHAWGLCWSLARVELGGAHAATLVAGPFRAPMGDTAVPGEDARPLVAVPQLDERGQAQLSGWLQRMARTFAEIGRERAAMVDRLRRIAAITDISSIPNH
jgi:excisionase family DNA binding protein